MTATTPPRGIILVVDDEDVVRRAMSRSLKYGLGGAFEIEMARSGPEALEILSFTRKKTAPMIRKLVESAVANANVDAQRAGADFDEDELFVQTITVVLGTR